MKRILWILLGLVLVGGVTYAAFFRHVRDINVLIFSKTEQFRHSSIEPGIEALKKLGSEYDFSVEATEDANIFKEKQLKNYNVVVFLNTTGDILNEAQQMELNRFIQAGGGYVGIHAAADTEYDWPWYGELVGAYFNGHPNDPNVREGTLKVLDQKHESTQHLKADWTRQDEWYNYKDIQADLNILIEIDESSYEGGTHAPNQHPMAWYRDFDGGRSFYTGLGHTDESFSDPDFLKHLWGGISYAAGKGVPVDYARSTVAPEENRFSKVVLDEGLNEPMELEILPDGNILFIERRGAFKMYDYAVDSSRTLHTFSVFSGHEDGLLGMALDPGYAENNWIYFFYSPPGDEPKQHVSRFVFKDQTLDLESEKVVLDIALQRDQCCHSAGSLEFGPDGNLFISTGDNTSPRATGYAPIDERPDRGPWDAQKSSANTHDLRGKILRIHPEEDGSYTIPDGNLFAKDGSEGRPEIYVMGCRNPYRIHVDGHTGYLYWGDVGPDAGEPNDSMGPAGHDEVNQARMAGFFGWPYFVGDNKAYKEIDFDSKVPAEYFDPEKPINNSPNNTGAKELPPAQPAFIWYPYDRSPEFPGLGTGGRNAMAGPVFYHKDFPDSDKKFPEYYDGKLFAYDWMRGWIMPVTMDEEGNFVKMEPFLPNMEFNNPVDILFGPNGDLFMLEYGTNWFTQNKDARLVHLQYIAGNRQPLAKIECDKLVGAAPLIVQFKGEASIDFDGDSIQYIWTIEDETFSSQLINPSYTFEKPGVYDVRLKVEDPDGLFDEKSIQVMVGNELPQLSWKISGNKSFYWEGSNIDYEIELSDAEDGTLGNGIDPKAVTVSIDYLERGYDQTLIAQGHQAMMEASAHFLGKQLIEKSDCKGCHQMDQQSVGPTYLAVAEKYAQDPTAINYLCEKILKGGGGVWGDAIMAPHPQLTESEATQMAKFIVSLAADAPEEQGLPTKGNYTLKNHQGTNEEGSYVFTATYTDRGGKSIGPLTSREIFTLKSPKVQAETFDEADQAMSFTVTPDMLPGLEREINLVIGSAGSHICFKNMDLTGIQSVKGAVAAPSMFMEGGSLKFVLDKPDGEVWGEMQVETNLKPTLDLPPVWTDLKAIEGRRDVYVVFAGEEGSPICSIDWLEFLNKPKSGI